MGKYKHLGMLLGTMAFGVLAGQSAFAVPVDPTDPALFTDTWDFTGPAIGENCGGGNCNPVHVHPTTDPNLQWLSTPAPGSAVTVSGWEYDTVTPGIVQRPVWHDNKGIGVEGTGDTGQAKEIEDTVADNQGIKTEFIVLEFGSIGWVPISLTLNFVDANDDILIYGGNVGPGSLTFNPQTNGFDDALEMLLNTNIQDHSQTEGAFHTIFFNDFGPLPDPVQFLYIFADFIDGQTPGTDNGGDSFQLAGLQGAIGSVPEPSMLGLFGFGLIGLAFIARRHRRFA